MNSLSYSEKKDYFFEKKKSSNKMRINENK